MRWGIHMFAWRRDGERGGGVLRICYILFLIHIQFRRLKRYLHNDGIEGRVYHLQSTLNPRQMLFTGPPRIRPHVSHCFPDMPNTTHGD